MTDEPTTRTLDDLSIADLKMRLAVLNVVIKDVNTTGTPDERAKLQANVIPQQVKLNEALIKKLKAARAEAGIPEPPAQAVKVQTLTLYPKAQGTGDAPRMMTEHEFIRLLAELRAAVGAQNQWQTAMQ